MKTTLADVVTENRRTLNDLKHRKPQTAMEQRISRAILAALVTAVIVVEAWCIAMGHTG